MATSKPNTVNPFAAFTKALSDADDALQAEKRDLQYMLERLVGAGWKLVDHVDGGQAESVDSLTEVIDRFCPDPLTGGARKLAQTIYDEWPLIFNFERVIAAAKALAPQLKLHIHPDVEVVRELNAALAPFQEG